MHLKTSRCKSPHLSAKVLEHNFLAKSYLTAGVCKIYSGQLGK